MTQERAIRLFDLCLAASGCLLLAPVFVVSAGAVLLFLGYPPFYTSRRVGRAGRLFTHIKLRSMLAGAERGRVFFEQERLTSFGRFLRATHLDELPELWHILRGEMSFVGPRPLPPHLLSGLDTRLREQVPPGWTGPAQLWLLHHGRLAKAWQIELDNLYVEHRSPRHNLAILLATARGLLGPRQPVDMSVDGSEDRRRFFASLAGSGEPLADQGSVNHDLVSGE